MSELITWNTSSVYYLKNSSVLTVFDFGSIYNIIHTPRSEGRVEEKKTIKAMIVFVLPWENRRPARPFRARDRR